MEENRAPVAIEGIAVTAALLGANGEILQQGRSVRIARRLAPGERIAIDAGVGALTKEQLPQVRVRVDAARAVAPQ